MVGYGTILSMRDVRVAGTQSGIGTAAGAVAGGIAGSAIGGGWRGPALAGIAGAVIGGIAGTAVERGVTQGIATEFIIREDGGQTIAVVQTNEQQLQPGERVVLLQGRELRIARAAGEYAPPPQPRRPAPSRTIPQRQSGGLKG
ncbi:MAG: glycine zipper 2TM domain-containing protein [Alphaproteobacteria bacterium]|nr:glycine zipper 2TM domain-containing protein [Alphaproteobacteria bacterium]